MRLERTCPVGSVLLPMSPSMQRGQCKPTAGIGTLYPCNLLGTMQSALQLVIPPNVLQYYAHLALTCAGQCRSEGILWLHGHERNSVAHKRSCAIMRALSFGLSQF